MTEIHGLCPPQFDSVRNAFAANFDAGEEIGAGFAAAIDGEIVVDIWAGHADRAKQKPWTAETLAPVFSSSKGVNALVFARAAAEGRIDYRARVTDVWPEFAQAGKADITIEQALSHQAGLVGFTEPMDPALWFDWDAICARLAAEAPLWAPGTASGYHPMTWGYLAGEIYRRATGERLSQSLRRDFTEPFGLDLWMGLPPEHHHRVAEVRKPTAAGKMGEITPVKRTAFLMPWSGLADRGSAEWRQAELPSTNVHATAPALAKLMAIAACDGELEGRRVIAAGGVAEAARARICGMDLILGRDLCWGAGFLRNERIHIYGPGDQTFGHSGWGGSCLFADPERRVSGAYVMNKQSVYLTGDPRPSGLIDTLYSCL
ncbi:MAG: serine hydrolase domain-containing protein [Caulobacteraceae bacterium]